MDVLKRDNILVSTLDDMVTIKHGSADIHIHYNAALNIVPALRIACKAALRYVGADPSEWRNIGDDEDDFEIGESYRGFRQSGRLANCSRWRVDVDGALVSLVFDEHTICSPFEDMTKVMRALRQAAKQAKAWAGDSGTTLRVVGRLTDAEQNYKQGMN